MKNKKSKKSKKTLTHILVDRGNDEVVEIYDNKIEEETVKYLEKHDWLDNDEYLSDFTKSSIIYEVNSAMSIKSINKIISMELKQC